MPEIEKFTKPGLSKAQFAKIAEARLDEFKTLAGAKHYVASVYMAGYAVEALLKCAICKTLDTDCLPKAFEFHDLGVLLFLSGLEKKMPTDMNKNFKELCDLWKSARIRYEDPASPNITEITCNNLSKWLNDPKDGLVPWLKGYFQ